MDTSQVMNEVCKYTVYLKLSNNILLYECVNNCAMAIFTIMTLV